MIRIVLQRQEFFSVVLGYAKTARGPFTLSCKEGRLYLETLDNGTSCLATYDAAFEGTISQANMKRLVSINQKVETLVQEIVLTLDPETRRLKTKEFSLNVQNLRFLDEAPPPTPDKRLTIRDETSEFLLYTTPQGEVKVEVLLGEETIWLTLNRMATLFGVDKSGISRHLRNIYQSGELEREATVAEIATVQEEGGREVRRELEYYNLDAIISVGYRVNSAQATHFRIWATQTLREYLIKGFAMDDERLKNGRNFRKDYFRELLERIRSIRASERRVYQQITDIFAECSIDYDPQSKTTQNFYAHV